jgi:hypothetical protein
LGATTEPFARPWIRPRLLTERGKTKDVGRHSRTTGPALGRPRQERRIERVALMRERRKSFLDVIRDEFVTVPVSTPAPAENVRIGEDEAWRVLQHLEPKGVQRARGLGMVTGNYVAPGTAPPPAATKSRRQETVRPLWSLGREAFRIQLRDRTGEGKA